MNIVDNIDVVKEYQRAKNGREPVIHEAREHYIAQELESKHLVDLLLNILILDRHQLFVFGTIA